MTPEKALLSLKDAIQKVKSPYYTFLRPSTDKIKVTITERSFAYELYHQWSLTLNEDENGNDQQEENEEQKIRLNGELAKQIIVPDAPNKYKFPDLILHGGQDDYKHQLLICEIKVRNNRNPSKKNVWKDLISLAAYKNLRAESTGEDCGFKKAVYLIFCTPQSTKSHTEEKIKKLLRDSVSKYGISDDDKKCINNAKEYIQCLIVETDFHTSNKNFIEFTLGEALSTP